MYAKTLKQQAFFTQTKSSLSKALPQRGWELGKIKRGHPTIGGFPQPSRSRQGGQNSGERSITTRTLRARAAGSAWVRATAVIIPLMLLAPALWNGYPLLQWDTGGYLARWYEGYLVPSRSTVFGLYLHFGEASNFWINL